MKINIQSINYYSELDEENFYSWVLDIKCIERIHSGFLFIDETSVDKGALKELLALFRRYNINSSRLAVFYNTEDE